MSNASTITAVTVRVAGALPIEVSLRNLGTAEQEASMRMGELLVCVRSPSVAERISQVWTYAKPIVCTLPQLASVGKLHLPVRVSLVGTIVRFAGYPTCTTVGVPARCGSQQPAHVRIQVGPLAWEVCDQLAWHTITRAWRTLTRQLQAYDEE